MSFKEKNRHKHNYRCGKNLTSKQIPVFRSDTGRKWRIQLNERVKKGKLYKIKEFKAVYRYMNVIHGYKRTGFKQWK